MNLKHWLSLWNWFLYNNFSKNKTAILTLQRPYIFISVKISMSFRHNICIRIVIYVTWVAVAGNILPAAGTAYECRAGPTPEYHNVATVSEVGWRACRPINETRQGCKCESIRIEGTKIAHKHIGLIFYGFNIIQSYSLYINM